MKNVLVLWLALALVVLACTFNDKDFQIKGVSARPTFAVPLASGNLSITDILSNQDSANIKVKSDGLVYLSYDQALVSQDIRDLVTLPNVGNLNKQLFVSPRTRPPTKNNLIPSTTLHDLGL